MIVTAGKTNVSVYFYIVQDASNTSPGEPVTGLLFSDIETGGSASYARQGAARVDLTLITLGSASATHADGGFILVDDTNMPGLYRCDFPDAAFATGVDEVNLQVAVASGKNAVGAPINVQILDVDLRDAVRGGMTALPNAAADAALGLPISDAGGLDLDARLDAAISSRLAPTTAARTLDIAATGEVALDFDSTIGTLAAAQFATDFLTAAKIATDAIDKIRDAILSDATTFAGANINATISSRATPAQVKTEADLALTDIDLDHLSNTGAAPAPTAGSNLANLEADVAAVQSDTDDIQSRIPTALVGGAMDSDVSLIQTDAISAAAMSAAAAQKIRDEILPTQNAAFDDLYFLFVAASDHVTPVTGASTMSVTRSIDGGAFGSGTGTGPTEVSDGIYKYDASAADMNGGKITFRFVATGGTPGAPDDVFISIITGGGV